jgi:diguanylate cyclase (GGDEF)-like protein
MPGHGAHSHKSHHTGGHGGDRSKESTNRAPTSQQRVVSMQRRTPVDKDLEGLLSSAMLVTDKELGNVIHEVDEISKALRSNDAGGEALRRAVHPAVWFAVKHVLLERELRQLALTDDLTCLYNRRGFFAAAAQQMKLAQRNGRASLLFFFDLDNLKDINDSFGHREGDRALVRMADALEEVFRDSDILARLGGDEFAALAFDASAKNENSILHRLEKSVRDSNKDEPRYILSVSTGTARYDPARGGSLADLIAEADRAMYAKKKDKQRLFSSNASNS